MSKSCFFSLSLSLSLSLVLLFFFIYLCTYDDDDDDDITQSNLEITGNEISNVPWRTPKFCQFNVFITNLVGCCPIKTPEQVEVKLLFLFLNSGMRYRRLEGIGPPSVR